ncbi:MAG: Cleavage and polyadenylation specificity factor subunit 6 [Paramarteilia canceri]
MSDEDVQLDLYDDATKTGNDEHEIDDDIVNIAVTSTGNNDIKKRYEDNISHNEDSQSNKSYSKIKIPVLSSTYDQQKFGIYLSNLNWWTNDIFLVKLCDRLGLLEDLLEIKFYENKNNGQSKGFAMLSFKTRQSAEIGLKKFNNKQIDDKKNIVACVGNKNNLEMLKQQVGANQNPRAKQENSFQINNIIQTLSKNPSLAAQVIEALGPAPVSQSFNQTINKNNFSHNSEQDQLFFEFSEKTNKALKECQEMVDSGIPIKRAVYRLLDCAEEMQHSEISRDHRVKLLLDSIYDAKRSYESKYDKRNSGFSRSNYHKTPDSGKDRYKSPEHTRNRHRSPDYSRSRNRSPDYSRDRHRSPNRSRRRRRSKSPE